MYIHRWELVIYYFYLHRLCSDSAHLFSYHIKFADWSQNYNHQAGFLALDGQFCIFFLGYWWWRFGLQINVLGQMSWNTCVFFYFYWSVGGLYLHQFAFRSLHSWAYWWWPHFRFGVSHFSWKKKIDWMRGSYYLWSFGYFSRRTFLSKHFRFLINNTF